MWRAKPVQWSAFNSAAATPNGTGASCRARAVSRLWAAMSDFCAQHAAHGEAMPEGIGIAAYASLKGPRLGGPAIVAELWAIGRIDCHTCGSHGQGRGRRHAPAAALQVLPGEAAGLQAQGDICCGQAGCGGAQEHMVHVGK